LEAAWFGIPNAPNCFVQQLIPINGLTIRPDLIASNIVHDFDGKMKRIHPMAGMNNTRGRADGA
jgi:hypothetical protein